MCMHPWFFSIGRLHFGQGFELASILCKRNKHIHAKMYGRNKQKIGRKNKNNTSSYFPIQRCSYVSTVQLSHNPQGGGPLQCTGNFRFNIVPDIS